MTRFLHRPMFRTGGSAGQGITSGLSRQRYEEGKAVGGDLISADFETQSPTLKRPRDSSGADFWLNWGTNILAQPGGRPILQTLGTAAKEPLLRLQASRAAKAKQDFLEQQYKDKMDWKEKEFEESTRQFGLEMEQDRYLGELAAKGQNEFKKEMIDKVWDARIANEPDASKHAEMETQRLADIDRYIVQGEDVSDQFKILSNENAMYMAQNLAEAALKKVKNPNTGVEWAEEDEGYEETLLKLYKKYIKMVSEFLLEEEKASADEPIPIPGKAAGGRAGYLGGGRTEDINVMTKTPGGIADINIAERDSGTTNEVNISYGQLRDRLPPEISNDIVLLLSESYEAFADFAEIQTQADVNEFNTKYNVQLFLPQQTGA